MTSTDTQFTTRVPPWARVGTLIDEPHVTAAEAARLGGLNFEVELRPASFVEVDGSCSEAPDRHAVIRSDTRTFFDYVSSDYTPVQYAEAFEFLDGVDPRFVAAGSFSGGKRGFMVVQLPEFASLDLDLGGEVDPHDLFVVVRASHDRSVAVEVAVLPLRDKCMNQLPLPSFSRSAPQRWSKRHVGDPQAELVAIQRVLTGTRSYVDAFVRTARRLAETTVSREDVRIILKQVLPDRPRRDDTIEAIETLLQESPRVGFPGTGWGLVNAVSEYHEHGRSTGTRTDQSRFLSGLAGDTARKVGRTAELVLAGVSGYGLAAGGAAGRGRAGDVPARRAPDTRGQETRREEDRRG